MMKIMSSGEAGWNPWFRTNEDGDMDKKSKLKCQETVEEIGQELR